MYCDVIRKIRQFSGGGGGAWTDRETSTQSLMMEISLCKVKVMQVV